MKFHQNLQPPPVLRRQPRRKYFFENMSIGESFFVGNRQLKSMSSYVSRTTKDLDGRYVVRAELVRRPREGEDQEFEWVRAKKGDPDAVAGVGIYRVE